MRSFFWELIGNKSNCFGILFLKYGNSSKSKLNLEEIFGAKKKKNQMGILQESNFLQEIHYFPKSWY